MYAPGSLGSGGRPAIAWALDGGDWSEGLLLLGAGRWSDDKLLELQLTPMEVCISLQERRDDACHYPCFAELPLRRNSFSLRFTIRSQSIQHNLVVVSGQDEENQF
eukprot:924939-Pelagomonas_calceolata.AAC.2